MDGMLRVHRGCPEECVLEAIQITFFMNVFPSFSAVVRRVVVFEKNLVCTKSMSLLLVSATMV